MVLDTRQVLGEKIKQAAETIVWKMKYIVQFIKGARQCSGQVTPEERTSGINQNLFVDDLNRKRPRGERRQLWLDVIDRDIAERRPHWHGRLNYMYNREEIGIDSNGYKWSIMLKNKNYLFSH